MKTLRLPVFLICFSFISFQNGLWGQEVREKEQILKFIENQQDHNNLKKDPLVFVQGKPYTYAELAYLNQFDVFYDDIESLEVIKPRQAKALFGKNGRGGAVVVGLKNIDASAELRPFHGRNVIYLLRGEPIKTSWLNLMPKDRVLEIEAWTRQEIKELYPYKNLQAVFEIKVKKQKYTWN